MLKYKFRVFILFVLLFPVCVNAEVRNVSVNKTLVQGEYESRLLELVNEVRDEAGVGPLTLDYNLTYSSRKRAVEISVNYDRNHLRTDNRNWSTVTSEYGVGGSHFGENIAYATYAMGPDAVFDMWMNSTVHRNNILNGDYTSLGIGVVKSSNGYHYWVQNFGNGDANQYVPYIGYSEISSNYVLRYEDTNAINVTHGDVYDVTLNVGETQDIDFIINTVNNSDYPEAVSLKLLDWNSSNPDVVSVSNSSIVANRSGSSIISTVFGNEEISFEVLVKDNYSNFNGLIRIITNNKNEPLYIDIDENKKSYVLDGVSNNTVTQFYSNGDIVNKSNLDVRFCLDAECVGYLKPIRYESSNTNIVDYIQDEFIFNNSGQSTITAIFENGISVVIPINVYYFKFDKNEYTLDTDKSIQTTVISDFSEIKYSSDNLDIVRIDNYGKVTAVNTGSTYIYAWDNNLGLFARALVTVNNKKQVSIEIDRYNAQLILGDSLNLKVTVDPIDSIVKYSSSDESVATVDSNGKVTAVGLGDAVITVTVAGESKSVSISVKDKEVIPSKIELDRTSVELFELETVKINATVSPIQALTWYSDNSLIAIVNSDGLITAIKNGTTTIHVVSEDGCEVLINVVVKLRDIPITDINIDRDSVVLTEGDSFKINANVYPLDTTDSLDLVWRSSNTSIATVTASGLITAIGNGEATITVTSINGVSKTINVIVNKKLIPISNIVLSKDYISLVKGESTTIKASIYPLDTTLDKNITWSSNNTSVAVVDNNGKITALSRGNAIITATSVNGVQASIEVSVFDVRITDIKLNYNKVILRDDVILKITDYTPGDVELDMSQVKWSSSNQDVVIVHDGKLIPIGIGDAVITVRYGDAYDECLVIVDSDTAIKPFGDIIDREDPSNCIDSILIDNTLQLEFIINDELKVLSNYENFKIKWESSNNLIIDENGKADFISPGIGYIKASFGLYSVTRYFNVYDIVVKCEKYTIYVGENLNISVVVKTPEVTTSSVHYELDNYSIASISDDGVLTGLRNGNVTITIYSIDRLVHKNITVKVISKNNDTNIVNPVIVSKPIVNSIVNVKDDNSANNEIVENKFVIVFENNTFTLEDQNGKVKLKLTNNTNKNNIKLSANEELIGLFNISVSSGDISKYKGSSYTIRIPIKFDDDEYDSFYFAEIKNSKVNNIMDMFVYDDYIEFETDHFDDFAIIGTKSKSSMKEDEVVPDSKEMEVSDGSDMKGSHLIRFIIVFVIVWILLFLIINKLITKFFKKKRR